MKSNKKEKKKQIPKSEITEEKVSFSAFLNEFNENPDKYFIVKLFVIEGYKDKQEMQKNNLKIMNDMFLEEKNRKNMSDEEKEKINNYAFIVDDDFTIENLNIYINHYIKKTSKEQYEIYCSYGNKVSF